MDLLDNFNETQKKEFQRISNKLLATCFVSRKVDLQDYRFISKHKKRFTEYFDVGGFRLLENEEYGVFQLVNQAGHNRKQFNLNESILLLILRILYDEKKRELSLVNDAICTIGEIQDMYQAIRKGKNITKTDLRNGLATMRRFNIVSFGKLSINQSFSISDEGTPIIILDTVAMAVPMQDIRDVYKKLESYSGKKKDEETDQYQTD